MSFPYINTRQGVYRGVGIRSDSDGSERVYARSTTSISLNLPAVIQMGASGYQAYSLFDTTFASTTAASHQQYFIGVADQHVASGSDGWFQIGGYRATMTIATTSVTAEVAMRWSNASIITSNASDVGFVADFATVITTASDTSSAEVLLFSRRVCGIT